MIHWYSDSLLHQMTLNYISGHIFFNHYNLFRGKYHPSLQTAEYVEINRPEITLLFVAPQMWNSSIGKYADNKENTFCPFVIWYISFWNLIQRDARVKLEQFFNISIVRYESKWSCNVSICLSASILIDK